MKPTLLLLFFCFLGTASFGQTGPCVPGGQPVEDCLTACAVCDFQGMSGESSSFSGGGAAGFCGTLHNDQWIAFVAGGTSVTLTLMTSDCLSGDGLQFAIYEACSGVVPLDCNGGCTGCAGVPLQLSNVPLVIGQTYYIVIDGYIGDACKWSLSASPLSALTPPNLRSPAAIDGPSKACPQATVIYSFDPPLNDGASEYLWEVPPNALINGQSSSLSIPKISGINEVTVTFGNVGGSVSVTPKNSCKTGVKRSKNVTISPIPPTILPAWKVCPAQFPLTLPWGDVVPAPPPAGFATYSTTLPSFQGCDSIIRLSVNTTLPIQMVLPIQYLCEGDSIQVCGQFYKKSGTYSVKCLSWKGCDSTIIFTVNVAGVEIKGGGSLNCFNGAVPLEAPATTGTAVWKNPSGDVLGTDKTYTATTAGVYTLYWTASLGGRVCTTVRSIQVKDVDTLRVKITPPGVITCSQPVSTLLASANMPASFFWDGPGAFVSNSSSTATPQPGIYVVKATTSGGCMAEAEVVVTGNVYVPKILNISALSNCATHTIKLDLTLDNPQTPIAYEWLGPSGFRTNLKSPTVTIAGTYFVTITNVTNGCTQSSSVNAQYNPASPVVTANGGIITCLQPSVTLTVTTGNIANPTIQWTGPNGFTTNQASPVVTMPGIYTAIVTNPANSCIGGDTALVLINAPALSATAKGGELTCLKDSVEISVTAIPPPVLCQWSGPGGYSSTILNPVVRIPGSYQVTVTNPFTGCTASAVAVVVLNTNTAIPVTITGSNALSCVSPKVTLSASTQTPASAYQWSGPAGFSSTQAQVEVSIPGLYKVTVTTTNACTGTASIEVEADAAVPVVNINGGNIVCSQAATLTAVSNTPGVTFSWTGPNNFASSQTQVTVVVPGTYQVTATNTNGCTSVAAKQVQQISPLVIDSIGYRILSCFNPSVPLTPVSGTPIVSYQWTGPSGFASSGAQPNVVVPGIYNLTATDANGCTATTSVTVPADMNTPLLSITGGNIFCNQPAVLTAVSNVPQANFHWSGPNGFASTQTQVSTITPGVYQVTVTNPVNGCTNSATTEVEQFNPTLIQSINGGVLTCAQTSVTLVPVANVPINTYIWSGPNGFSATQAQVTVSAPGIYQLSVVGANGCTQSISRVVTSNTTAPSAQAVGGVLGCNPTTLTLNCITNVANATYGWSGPHGFLSNIRNPVVNRSGTYTVTVTNTVNGCTRSAGVTVFDNGNAPQAFLSIEFIGAGRRRINCFTTAVTPVFAWTGPSGFTSTDQNPVVITPGLYTVLVTDGITDCQSYESILLPAATSANGKATGGRAAPTGQGWNLSPNPSTGHIQLRYSGEEKPGQTTVTVLDGAGRIVASQQFSDGVNIEMDLSNLPQGLYRISLQNDWGVAIKSLSIQH